LCNLILEFFPKSKSVWNMSKFQNHWTLLHSEWSKNVTNDKAVTGSKNCFIAIFLTFDRDTTNQEYFSPNFNINPPYYTVYCTVCPVYKESIFRTSGFEEMLFCQCMNLPKFYELLLIATVAWQPIIRYARLMFKSIDHVFFNIRWAVYCIII
jgi:hypothetical protein